MTKKQLTQALNTFGGEEWYRFGVHLFQIVPQPHKNRFAVHRVTLCRDGTLDDGQWIRTPEENYETVAGARYGLLLHAATEAGYV